MSSATESLTIVFRYTSKQNLIFHEDKNKSVIICSKFHKDKVCVAYLSPSRKDPRFDQLLLITNLKVLGMKAVSVKVTCSSLDMDAVELEEVSDVDEFSTGGLQLFVTSNVVDDNCSKETHTFTFDISATSCVDNYQVKLLDCLLKSQLRLNRGQQQSDVVLIVNSCQYPCHKAILAARSPVFLDKFIVDPNITEVDIEAHPLTTDADMQQFLEFVYTGQFTKPLISKQLSLLAKTFEIETLIELCNCAQQEMTMTHLMNLAILVEPYQDPLESAEFGFHTTETPAEFLMKQSDAESELPVDIDIVMDLKFTCCIDWIAFEALGHKQSVTLGTFPLRNQPMFHAKMTRFDGQNYLVFTAVELGQIGLKIAQVTLLNGDDPVFHYKMIDTTHLSAARLVNLIQIFRCATNLTEPCDVTFHVNLSSSSVNFGYQLVDATWTEQLWAAAQNKQLTDVEFLVDGKAFGVHRFIVSSRSPVFAAMFSSDMIEANTGAVTINETDSDVFETFLQFLYTGNLEPFSLASDYRLRALADKYQVKTLLSLSPENKEDLVDVLMSF